MQETNIFKKWKNKFWKKYFKYYKAYVALKFSLQIII